MRTAIAMAALALLLGSCGVASSSEQLPPENLAEAPVGLPTSPEVLGQNAPAPAPQTDLGVIVPSGVQLDTPRPPPPDFVR